MAKVSLENATTHFSSVEFMLERFPDGQPNRSEKASEDLERIDANARRLAKEYGVNFNENYVTQWDGHQFFGEDKSAVDECAKKSTFYVARFKHLMDAF